MQHRIARPLQNERAIDQPIANPRMTSRAFISAKLSSSRGVLPCGETQQFGNLRTELWKSLGAGNVSRSHRGIDSSAHVVGSVALKLSLRTPKKPCRALNRDIDHMPQIWIGIARATGSIFCIGPSMAFAIHGALRPAHGEWHYVVAARFL